MRTQTLTLLVLLAASPLAAQTVPIKELQDARPHYPTPIVDAGALLNEVASKVGGGWGMQRKKDGASCAQPVTGIRIACDILMHRPTARGCDVLGDTENKATPTDQGCGPADTNLWVDPVPVNGPPSPTPTPTPVPDDGLARDVAQLRASVTALESAL